MEKFNLASDKNDFYSLIFDVILGFGDVLIWTNELTVDTQIEPKIYNKRFNLIKHAKIAFLNLLIIKSFHYNSSIN